MTIINFVEISNVKVTWYQIPTRAAATALQWDALIWNANLQIKINLTKSLDKKMWRIDRFW